MTSRHDIEVEERLSADSILIQPGDEVRWINYRKLAARVEIPQLKEDDLSCQRGFTNWMGSLGETASLCFKNPAGINYNVRAETSLPGRKQVLPGVIKVGNPLPQ